MPDVHLGNGATAGSVVPTLGTGNRFIEVHLDEEDSVRLMLHSGSRDIGNEVGPCLMEPAEQDVRIAPDVPGAVGCLPMCQQDVPPDLRLAAVCGLPCEACSLFIGSHDDPARLRALAAKTQRPIEQLRCEGCRSERRAAHCQQCEFVACAGTRGIGFCGQCAEYPCERLASFQAAMPHRIELWEDQGRIHVIGHERWLREKRAHYSCPQCQTMNAAYDRRCWKCGHEPSCRYVELHRQALLDHPLTRA